MILTYGLTTVIVGAWILKMIQERSFIFKKTPLDLPLLLFLIANILSTIFSIDRHTSIWGYYSRSNGGLLSLISYLLLYFAFVSNLGFKDVKNVLKSALVGGFLISLWAIFEHFGVSFSCVLLRGEFNDACWIQDVQARVFATLGQPNWLAAYLSMLIFPALYFLLTSQTLKERIMYYTSLIIMYLAFTFTYSRGPTLGIIAGGAVFVGLWIVQNRPWKNKNGFQNPTIKVLAGILASFLIVNILFGSALTSFRLVSKFAAPARPAISIPPAPTASGSQLENGGTESGEIRLIVWKGALDIFKHYPIFGSGLETFAYSYYQFRPASHNLTSEWDFLYNKAHNEYLNYLSTTGIVGIGTYLFMIGFFVYWSFKKLITSKPGNPQTIFVAAILGSYISYLIYNFFLFSVVIIAIFFYVFPGLVFVATDSIKTIKWPKKLNIKPLTSIISWVYSKPFNIRLISGAVIILTGIFLFSIFQIWYADTVFDKGEKAVDSGNVGEGYNLLTTASEINPGEPFYRSELGYAAAASASSLKELDATLSAQLKNEALLQTDLVLIQSPKNVSFWRTAIRTYFELSTINSKYLDNTLSALDTTIKLAPTDPKLYYNKALILDSEGKKAEEIKLLEQAIQLKPNYIDAINQLKVATAGGVQS